jgi:hypothetical protein
LLGSDSVYSRFANLGVALIAVRSLFRPCLSVLLVALLAIWGICPCVHAKMLGIAPPVGEPASADASSSPVAACCCKVCVSVPTSAEGANAPAAPSRDCPCCKRGDWMRDLPPQAQVPMLEAPTPAAFDVPHLAVTELALDRVSETAVRDTGPPTSLRPHASPVGIVRLLN